MNKAEEVILTLNIFIEDVLNVYPNLKRRYSFGRCYIIGSCALILQGVSERKTDDIDIYFHGKRKSFNNFYNKVSPIAINYNIDLLNKVSSDNYVVDETTLTDCLIENFSSKGFPLKILKPEAIYLMKLSLPVLREKDRQDIEAIKEYWGGKVPEDVEKIRKKFGLNN